MNSLGKIIQSYRLSKNLKQDTVSKAIGISQASYCRIENDKQTPTIKELYMLSIYLNFSLDKTLTFAFSENYLIL